MKVRYHLRSKQLDDSIKAKLQECRELNLERLDRKREPCLSAVEIIWVIVETKFESLGSTRNVMPSNVSDNLGPFFCLILSRPESIQYNHFLLSFYLTVISLCLCLSLCCLS